MRSGTPNVWVRSSDDELLRADTLVRLRCHDGVVEATSAAGRQARLTGPGCPPDFHLQLLLELARVNLDDRWVVVAAEGTAKGAKWARRTADDLVGRSADA